MSEVIFKTILGPDLYDSSFGFNMYNVLMSCLVSQRSPKNQVGVLRTSVRDVFSPISLSRLNWWWKRCSSSSDV